MRKPLISFVVTVYNKRQYLENTVHSLVSQTGMFDSEFIFVDDASSDGSCEYLEGISDSRIRVIKNAQNCGPAIRINQGVRYSQGDYLHFIDADDCLIDGAASEMLEILQKEGADVIYGKWGVSKELPEALRVIKKHQYASYVVSSTPLKYVLTHKNIVKMAMMVKRTCFLSSGGCDEKIFVQDESLPLRLSRKAEKFVDYSGLIMLVPPPTNFNLSYNKIQQHHDGFWATLNAISDFDDQSVEISCLLNRKAMSILWKHYNRTMKGNIFSIIFIRYILSKYLLIKPSLGLLTEMSKLFDPYRDQIRRPF